ncbi:hypothetical protein L3i20_v215550 [Paenibacillus sp. L3-i20]|nr:hypothetical protein L3i20_v215550 [Paenibacillus sp. L3-i20]
MKWGSKWKWRWSALLCIALLISIGPDVHAAPKDSFVIKPKYAHVEPFNNGVALVANDDMKWGLIDKSGRELIKPQYEITIPTFEEGMVLVSKDGKWGYINQSGKEAIKLIYDQGRSFSEGKAAVKVGHKWGYIDKAGTMKIKPAYYDAGKFAHGRAIVNIAEYKSGIVNHEGNLIHKYDYTIIDDASFDIASRQMDKDVEEPNENFLWSVDHNNRWGFLDKVGNEIIPPTYSSPGTMPSDLESENDGFSEGIAVVELRERYGPFTWAFIDRKGNILTELSAYQIRRDNWISRFVEGRVAFCTGQPNDMKCGYLDKKGKEIVAPKYDDVVDFSEGLAAVKLNEKWGFVNRKGEEIVKPKYKEVIDFANGLAAVMVNDKYGFINKKGAAVIKAKYDAVDEFKDGRAWVSIDNKWGVIDQSGKVIIDLKYGLHFSSMYPTSRVTKSDLIIASKNEKYGFIDQSGKELTEFIYKKLEMPIEGLAAASLDGEKWGFITIPVSTQ